MLSIFFFVVATILFVLTALGVPGKNLNAWGLACLATGHWVGTFVS